jgi:prevent-host-death family protein
MITLSIGDAQAQLPKLLTLVSEGNEVIISADNKPIARIVPFSPPPKKRTAGLNKGKVKMSKGFDDPLPEAFWTGVV